ncbi:MAG: carbon monoxide dehydrogenase/acetyl-CoA synthase methytransferase subunit [Termitinemataceae bacterium]|nr:MAG: carbon monoxide dehydrogenase/acetyl-CoA synthase methytransferase subunit [Termitinemataceae bacterium]
MAEKFIMIGENIHCIAPAVKEAMDKRDPTELFRRAEMQLKAGATYLDLNIGPPRAGIKGLMAWGIKELQQKFDNVPIALDTADVSEIESGIAVYNRAKGKPIVNSADAGERIKYIDVAAANDAICFSLCSKEGVPSDNDEREACCMAMIEHAMGAGMENPAEDLWFDPLFVVIKGMQDKQKDVLNFIRWLSDQGFKSTGGLSNVSNGMPKALRPVVNSYMVAMSIGAGLTSAIVNPCEVQLATGIRNADVIMDAVLFADSFLDDVEEACGKKK